MEALFTPATLAKRWECSDKHVRNLIAAGKLECFRLGGKLVRIRASDVEKFEARNSSPAPETAPSAASCEPKDISAMLSAPLMRARLASLRRR